MHFDKSARLRISMALAALALSSAFTAAAQMTEVAVELPEPTDTLEVGESIEGELSDDARIVAYEFEAEEDTPLTFLVTPDSDDFFSALLIIYDEEGEVIYTSEDDPLDGAIIGGASAPMWTAPEDGTYTAAVSTRSYAFYEDDSAPEGSFTLSIDEAEFETLEYGEPAEGSLSEDRPFALYVLETEDLDIVQATLESDFENAQITLDSLEDDDFSSRDSNNVTRSTTALTPVYIPSSDRFLVVVQYTGFSGELGDYTLTVDRYEPTPLTVDEPATVEISVETVTNYLRYEGEEDQVLTITAVSSVGTDITIVVFDPDGRVIAVEEYNEPVTELELLEDGEYTLMVYPSGFMVDQTDLGEVEVTIEVE